MYGNEDGSGKRRALAAGGALAVHAVIAGVLVWGLSVRGDDPAGGEARLVTVAVEPRPTPTPTPSPPPERAEASAPDEPAGDQGTEGEALPREAPEVALPFPMPPAAPVAGDGIDRAAGSGTQGAGSGAGGSGTGSGGGGSGGAGTPAQRIAGALRNSDYPASAERQGLAGTVGISFRVRTDGAVDRCTVVRSSGHPVLDDLTCRLFVQRYRFRPATDARGTPVESTLQTSFTWGTRRR